MSGESRPSPATRLEVDAGVATIVIDRAPVNALSTEVLEGLQQHLASLAVDDAVRAVVITGAGNKVFASGADITELPGLLEHADGLAAQVTWVARIFDELAALPQPTIAAVQGDAAGGGLELALACDLIVASASARFSLPEVRLGLIPGAGGTQRLPRRIGMQRARAMVLLAERLTATQAAEAGLVYQVVDPGETLTVAVDIAARLAASPFVAVSAAKQAMALAEGLDLGDALKLERDQFLRVAASQDAREGCRAFLERRTPEFRHV